MLQLIATTNEYETTCKEALRELEASFCKQLTILESACRQGAITSEQFHRLKVHLLWEAKSAFENREGDTSEAILKRLISEAKYYQNMTREFSASDYLSRYKL